MENPDNDKVEVEAPPAQTDDSATAIDQGDGNVVVVMGDSVPGSGNPLKDDWFSNLAEDLDNLELGKLAEKYLDLIDQDVESRKERDMQYADGLLKAGMGGPAPGGADFDGASRVTHPILAESYVDFSASAIRELFPPNGPVKTKIDGKPNKDKMERAKRKSSFMNWQLTHEVKSFRPELECLLTQLPAGGSQYLKIRQDENFNRPSVEFIPIDDMILPFEARNFYDTPRKFHRMHVSDMNYERRIESGEYIDADLPPSSGNRLDQTETEKANDKIEGKRNDYSTESGERIIYEGTVYDQIEGDIKAPEGKSRPYLITIDVENRKVLALYRDWEEEDDTGKEIEHIVDFNFIPWRGALGIGLPHLIGDLSTALTGALRALLDSALIANMAGGLKLKGKPSGSNNSISPTQVTEVDAAGTTDDIRKLFMPIPFNQPSPVLFQLLGFLTDAAKGVVTTSEEKISEASNNMPVGTALALIEQGAKVFSAIHARQHDSLRRCLEIFHRLNSKYLPDKVQYGTDPDDYVLRKDFEGPMDVSPVSDPNIFSEAQRFAQIQFIFQSITTLCSVPGVVSIVIPLFDMRALYARMFEMAKIPNYEEFLPEKPEAGPLNPVDENVALCMGKPVKAFPGQNHEAHIQVLLDFAQNKMLGASPIMAPKFLPGAMNHLMDHLLTWYEEMMKADAAQGQDESKIDWDNDPQSSILLAKAAPVVDKASEIAFAQIPQLVAQGMQQLQQLAPKPPADPMVEVAKAEVQGKQQLAEKQFSLAQMKAQSDAKTKMVLAQSKADEATQRAQQAQRDYELELHKLGIQADSDEKTAIIGAKTEIRKQNMQSQTDLAKTIHNNASAQKIAEMKISADKSTRLSDGASLNQEN